jgi:2-succinyl-5-enolpyruvyl-6-hydroxy-3-cyclohexene-1-carboxylate synthase
MNDLFAKQIIYHLVEQGVRTVFIAPGSRLTPLVYAAAQEERLEKRVHFDERGIAFHAYGYAKGSKTPVVVLCTSGTAVAHFFPAVMEAALDDVPLLIISADRPPELRDCGANQTCDQVKIFGNYVRWYFEIPCPDLNTPPGFIGSTIAQAIFRATHTPKGPVHLNCLMREPFLSDHVAELTPPTHYDPVHLTLAPTLCEQWAKKLTSYERGVILVGSFTSPRNLKSIFSLAQQLDWPIFPDITSGLRSEGMHPNVIPYYDAVLKILPELQPDCILHLGDRMVSKPVMQWIQKNRPPLYAMVAEHPFRHDPTHTLTNRVQCDPALFAELILPFLSRRISWLAQWKTISQVIDGHLDEFIPFASEPGIVRFLHHHLPPHYALFAANGMPIRDTDQFFFPRFHRGPIFGKRGASGIDGNIATLIGIAEGAKRPLLGIIGDQTALHDLNSLPLLHNSKVPILLLIINNQGGGIFSFLPIAEKQEFFEKYWAAAHSWHFESAAKMFNLPYLTLTDSSQLVRLFREEKTTIIEFKSSRAANCALHHGIEVNIKEKIEALAGALT